METNGRVCITGVSSGLGYGLASYYLERGWSVHGMSRTTPADLVASPQMHFQAVDLSKLDEIHNQLERLHLPEHLDLVILNAGILGQFGDISTVDLALQKTVMDVNLWANKVILDYLIQVGITVDQVVAISSGASTSGARGWNSYGVSKAALNMLVQLYAQEMEHTHLCALAPGLIDSDMQEYLFGLEHGNLYPTLERLQNARQSGAMPTVDEAADTVATCIAQLPVTLNSGEYADVRNFRVS